MSDQKLKFGEPVRIGEVEITLTETETAKACIAIRDDDGTEWSAAGLLVHGSAIHRLRYLLRLMIKSQESQEAEIERLRSELSRHKRCGELGYRPDSYINRDAAEPKA